MPLVNFQCADVKKLKKKKKKTEAKPEARPPAAEARSKVDEIKERLQNKILKREEASAPTPAPTPTPPAPAPPAPTPEDDDEDDISVEEIMKLQLKLAKLLKNKK